MKKKFVLAFILLISANLISCKKEQVINNPQSVEAAKVAENNSGLAKRKMEVPFKGNLKVTIQVLQGPPVINQIISGTGNATHLGNLAFRADVWVNVTTGEPFQVIGTATFTAANGDQFFTIVSGVSTPTSKDGIIAKITHTITGGTGRFQNASGTLYAVSTAGTNGTADVNINGQISF